MRRWPDFRSAVVAATLLLAACGQASDRAAEAPFRNGADASIDFDYAPTADAAASTDAETSAAATMGSADTAANAATDAATDAQAPVSTGESAIAPGPPDSAQLPDYSQIPERHSGHWMTDGIDIPPDLIPNAATRPTPADAGRIDGGSLDSDGPADTAATAGDDSADAPCPAADNEIVPPAVCAAFGRLKPALAGFNAPAEVQLGDTVPIRFVISRDQTPPAELLRDLPGTAREFPVRVARFVRAELTARGGGLVVTPRSAARQDLLTRPQASWDWDVEAKAGGTQRLTLRVSIEVGQDDSGKLWETSQDRQILVRVPADARFASLLRRSVPLVGDLRTLVIALTALVAALGALWLAIRRFGRTDNSGEG